MITLTPEQEALLPVVRDEWIAHGLSTTPADRPAAERGVYDAYRAAGLEPPRSFIWLGSPMAGCIGAAMLANLPESAQVGDQIWAQVGAQVRAQAGAQVRARVGDQIWDQAGAQVGAQVRAQVGDQAGAQVRAQARAQVGDQIWAQVGDQIWAQVGAQVDRSMWGQHDAWLSFYAYFARIGITCADRMSGLMQVAAAAGWWWPFEGAAILTERPAELHRDQLGRLHSETGPAIRYPDGWGFHAWHGTPVPASLIDGDGWTPEQIFAEGNQEIRRCAIERIGWHAFIQQAGLAQIGDSAPDPGNPGNEIALYDVPKQIYDEPVRVLLCTNGTAERDGTRRRFGLTVPATISDPVEAAAWTYGWPVQAYKKLARRA